MATEVNRRSFLTGALRRKTADVMRPPGAVDGSFEALCSDCDLCQKLCPESVIAMDPAGQPVLDFSEGHCTFCGSCIEACPTGALAGDAALNRNWRAKIEGHCWSMNALSCRMCQDSCPENAIRFQLKLGGKADPSIDVEACTGCGACRTVCPANAVEFYSLPPVGKEAVA